MSSVSDLIKDRKIRDYKYGEELIAEKLQKKVGAKQFMMYKDKFPNTIYIITKEEIIESPLESIDKSAIYNNIKNQLDLEKGDNIDGPFLWWIKGDSKKSVLRWLHNFLNL